MSNAGLSGRQGWFKSSFSKDANSCVEVLFGDGTVYVRDTKYTGDPTTRPVIGVPADVWDRFLAIATGGAGDGNAVGMSMIELDVFGGAQVRDASGTVLIYTSAEWNAFVAGITAGEFSLVAA